MPEVVVISRQAQRDLLKLPTHVVVKFQDWVEDVEDRGLSVVRKVPGYHDEPLVGKLKGLRSIRLSRSYRAYYRVVTGAVVLVNVDAEDKNE